MKARNSVFVGKKCDKWFKPNAVRQINQLPAEFVCDRHEKFWLQVLQVLLNVIKLNKSRIP